MSTLKLALGTTITSRGNTLAKDAKLVNCYVEVQQDVPYVVSRWGMAGVAVIAAGRAQGLTISPDGYLYMVIAGTLYDYIDDSTHALPGASTTAPVYFA